MDHVYRFQSLHRLAAGLLAGLLLLGSAPLIAGNGKITGRVKDKQTGEPLIGGNVVVIQTVLQGGGGSPA